MRTDMNHHFAIILNREENKSFRNFREWDMDWKNFDRQLDIKCVAIVSLLRQSINRATEELEYNMQFRIAQAEVELSEK